MIKVGLIGASSPDAGELIRILINHPDVELMTAYDPNYKGRRLSSVHHGLIGETELEFTDELELDRLNLVFICERTESGGIDLTQLLSECDEELRIIDLSSDYYPDYEAKGFVYGLSETHRKPLVRGAKYSLLPSACASVALISLQPLVLQHQLLDKALKITYVGDFETDEWDEILLGKELSQQLRAMTDADYELQFEFESDNTMGRTIRMKISTESETPLDDVEKIYEDIYDDHTLTYIVGEPAKAKEVEGTDKCLISLTKSEEGMLQIDSVVDGKLRGGAGEAVHVMNLLFGLQERTGLNLKASNY